MRILFRLLRALRPYRSQVLLLLLCVLMVTVTSLVTPSIIQNVIDQGFGKFDGGEA